MKNGILKIFFIALMASAVISCSKDEPVQGRVDLDPSSKVVKFGEVFNIKPVFSATGIASSKTYTWKSNADSIVSVKAALGGVGQVTPKRIGQATITYASSDGKLSSSALITVDPRSTIFNGIFYKTVFKVLCCKVIYFPNFFPCTIFLFAYTMLHSVFFLV